MPVHSSHHRRTDGQTDGRKTDLISGETERKVHNEYHVYIGRRWEDSRLNRGNTRTFKSVEVCQIVAATVLAAYVYCKLCWTVSHRDQSSTTVDLSK